MKQIKLLLIILLISFSFGSYAQTTEKKVILQGFWWDYHNNLHNTSWANYLMELAPRLKSLGIDAVWIPPVYKNAGTNSVGYSPFDHYDLGDKYQKGDTRTRVGTKDEVLRLIAVLHANGIEVIQDIVLNHVTNAGASNGAGGLDPEATYSMATAGGFKNFRNVCYETPVPNSGQENATEYLNRKGRWSKNYTNFHPNANWNVSSGDWESSFWGPDFAYGIDQSGTGNGYGPSTNATYNPTQNYNYSRNQARDWIMWFSRQTGIDGFRWDAIKHFPPFVVQDLSYNLKYLNGHANLGEGMINFGEYVGGKTNLDNWVNNVAFSNFGNEKLAGTFDFGLRGAFKNISDAQGNYNLAQVPSEQQNERVVYYGNSNTYIHRTVPFVNNHDTYRPIKDSDGNITGWDGANEIGGHIEPNDPRMSLMYALTFALDGTPLIFFEDLFSISYNSNRYSHDPKNATTLPINSDLENIIWCHQNLDFGTGVYLVRGHNGNTGDHLIIERGGKAIVSVNDNWNTWQSDWVDSNFPPGTVLVDYSGANGNATTIVQNDQRVQISTPPCDGSASQGRRGYAIWAPQGIANTYTPNRSTSTTQEWEMEDDLGDSNCNSLQQGGRIPANSTAYRNVGRIFAAANESINFKLIPTDNTKDLTIELLDINNNVLVIQNGLDTLSGNYSAFVNGWINIRIKNTTANQTGQKVYVRVTYTAPEVVEAAQFPLLPNVATWTGSLDSDWDNCANWQDGFRPSPTINAIIPTNAATMPEISTGLVNCKDLTVEAGASMMVSGGNFRIHGDLINNGNIFPGNTCGTIIFNGSETPQTISGSPTYLCKVRFINPNGVLLNADLSVSEYLEFGLGCKVTIEDYNFTIGTDALVIAGNGYIVTKDDANSGGVVNRVVENSLQLFPVGNANAYTPIYIKSNTSTRAFQVRTFNQVFDNGNSGSVVGNINETINQTWKFEANGAIDVNVQTWWNESDEGNSFNRNTATVFFNNGNFWSGQTSTPLTGNNPYSINGSNITETGYLTVSSNLTVNATEINNLKQAFSVVPNPSNGIFKIVNNSITNNSLNISVYNTIGELILETNGDLESINQILNNKMQTVSQGIYLLKIKENENRITTLKIVID